MVEMVVMMLTLSPAGDWTGSAVRTLASAATLNIICQRKIKKKGLWWPLSSYLNLSPPRPFDLFCSCVDGDAIDSLLGQVEKNGNWTGEISFIRLSFLTCLANRCQVYLRSILQYIVASSRSQGFFGDFWIS